MTLKKAIKILEQAQLEEDLMTYFRTIINRFKDDFKKGFKSLTPIEKYYLYCFVSRRDKKLAKEIEDIMSKKKTVSFKIS